MSEKGLATMPITQQLSDEEKYQIISAHTDQLIKREVEALLANGHKLENFHIRFFMPGNGFPTECPNVIEETIDSNTSRLFYVMGRYKIPIHGSVGYPKFLHPTIKVMEKQK